MVLFCWSVNVPVPLKFPPRIRSSAVNEMLPAAPTDSPPVVVMLLPAPVVEIFTVFPAAVVIDGRLIEAVPFKVMLPRASVPPHALEAVMLDPVALKA